ncbi:MAG: ATP-binding protein [Desulfocapsaceae bacterium]|nr:ATP-binding protein [Desulfocapsaceae bacterium]
MNIIQRLITSVLPADPESVTEELFRQKRYKRFRYSLFLAMNLIGLIPMMLTAGLGFSQYRDLLQREERDQLQWNMEGAQKTIEAFVHELQSVVNFVAHEDRYQELLDQNNLQILFDRLHKQYPGFVDLGVIDSKGIQQAYVGPYNLQGKDYSHQDWFAEVVAKKVFISNVVMGFRQAPHFAIKVTKKIPGTNEHWVLRATINAETLYHFIETINTQASDDIFIVSRDGILQTPSLFYGHILDSFQLSEQSTTKGQINRQLYDDIIDPTQLSEQLTTKGQIREVVDSSGKHILQASVLLKNTPWILILTKEGYIHGSHWSSFRQKLFFIFAGCSIVGLLITIQLSKILTERIRESDEKRHALLTEAEHTHKLASIGRLAAGVAHEINNPLAIIDQKAGLIQDILEFGGDFENKDKVTASLLGIHNGVNRCKVITHRLLGFARRMDFCEEKVHINEVLKEVLSFLEKEAMYNHIKFNLNLQEDIPVIYSDQGQLQQIFLNIINNALDAIGHDGQVTITSQVEDDSVLIGIQDNGPGIPEKTLQHIFEPFFTTKETGKGTGLGLSITYGLVKKLGGTIRVTSTVGEGAFFEVRFPLSL